MNTKFFLLLNIVLLLLLSCKEEDDNTRVALSIPNITVDAIATLLHYNLDSNVSWYIEGDTEWCDIHPKSGNKGITELVFDIKANFDDTRFTEVRVVGQNGEIYAVINVNQKPADTSAEILSFSFLAENNPTQLISDIHMKIKDNEIEGRVPYYSDLSNLVASVEFIGEKLYVGSQLQEESRTANNFKKEVIYKVVSRDGEEKEYKVSLINFTGLPVISINTNKVEIVDKENWINGTMEIDGAAIFESAFIENISIRGRGNSTWTADKKPYAIKLDKKKDLLGMPSHKRWVLLANHFDATLLRNEIAFFLGAEYTNLSYTPRMEYAEVFLNNAFLGLYQLGEHIKIDKNRVDVTDEGYILEVDVRANEVEDIMFTTPRNVLFAVKEPDITMDGKRYNYIKDYICTVETVLYSDDFLNKENGYKKYVDIDSFADWYIVNEITKNNDAIFYSSCFMNIKPGGKLKMGPLWDFDLAFGNTDHNENYKPTGFWIKQAIWIERMFQDSEFVELVKEKFVKIAAKETEIMERINQKASLLQWSVIENNIKWGNLFHITSSSSETWGFYNNEVQFLKNWLQERLIWLKVEYEKL